MAQEHWKITKPQGFITQISPEDLDPNFAQESENIITDEQVGAWLRRKGSVSEYEFDSEGEVAPIRTLFAVGGKQQILASTQISETGNIHNSLSDYTLVNFHDWVGIESSQKPCRDAKWRCVEYGGVVYIVTGTLPLSYWTEAQGDIQFVGGNPLASPQDIAKYTVPWAKHIAIHKGTLFVGNLSAFPDGWMVSAFQDLETPTSIVAPYEAGAWQGTNKQTLGNGEDITNIISYGSVVVITQTNHIWIISGQYPQYFMQELRLDSGDNIGAIEDTCQIKDGVLYGADKKCIWAFNGSSLKNITEETIKSKYQDRTEATGFPLIDKRSLYIHEQKEFQQAVNDHSIDLEYSPGVIQLADFRNMELENGGFTNPTLGFNGNWNDYASSTGANWMSWEFKDPWDRAYALKILDFMIHYRAEYDITLYYKDLVTGNWVDATPKKIALTGGIGTEKIAKIAVFDAITEIAGLKILTGVGETVIYNMWFSGSDLAGSPVGGMLTLPVQNFTRCNNVGEWGHLEVDMKLANNITCEYPEGRINNPVNGVKIELEDGLIAFTETKRGALITQTTGLVDVGWRITLHDADTEGNIVIPSNAYPNYPKVYALKLSWLKTGSSWTYQPVAQSWEGDLYFSFPHTGDNRRLLVLDSNNNFHIYPCRNSISSFCVFDNNLYGGKTKSSADGYAEILKLDTGLTDTDSDDSTAITAKWKSKEFRLKDTRRQFELKRFNVIIENKEGSNKSLTARYVKDGITYTKTITAIANKEKPYFFWFSAGSQGYRVYFELEGAFDFQIKDMIVEANILSLLA